MNTNKTLGSNKQHSDRECLYKAEVTMTGKGTRFQEWMPVFFTVNILALVIPGYLQKSSITMTERN
ncbi:universal stress protein [Escherichia coli]|nr:universal stress protein [Escherichia coli]ENA99236.1 putative universal stress protein [Escherichia coli 2864350]EFN9528049.1 universal stress protein [Escherichia coli]EFO0125637.1 universal stress protein [Escherichia coli]EFO2973060.1 universal stress protein [Escherichia coli]